MMRSVAIRQTTTALLLLGSCVVSIQPQTVLAAEQTAYLWGIRRGCHTDALLEDAALSRIRAVGRDIVALNIPATVDARSCHGVACAEIIARHAECGQLSGPLLGAELDEVSVPGGVVTRIRAWRSDIRASSQEQAAVYEHVACSGETCGMNQISELTAKALSRLLERPASTGFGQGTASALPFPAAECVLPPANTTLRPYCAQPFGTVCREQDLSLEPSGRASATIGQEVYSVRPSASPRRWEWLPVIGSVVGLGASIGLGIANASVKIQGTSSGMTAEASNLLSPAVWTSVALTAVLGVSSAGIIGDRYHRETRAYQQMSAPSLCPLLVDRGPAQGAL